MRPKIGTLAAFLLISTALTTAEGAQQQRQSGGGGGGGGGGFSAAPHGGGGGGGGGFSAAPRISAPAPHISAPSAPAAHFAAPQRTAPRFASTPRKPHVAAPHPNTRLATPNRLSRPVAPRQPTALARHNVGPTANQKLVNQKSANQRLGSQKLATQKTQKGVSQKSVSTSIAGGEKQRGTSTGADKVTGKVTGNAAAITLNTPKTAHLQMHYTGGSPILRNTALANLSSRDPATRSLTQSTFRGNFAQSNWGRDWGWRHRHHHFVFGFVLGFVGPVFWPYAYDDFIDYAFWPYAYDTFWPYAFDDVFEGIYGAYAPQYYAPQDAYAYAGGPASSAAYARATGISQPSAALPGGSQICSGQAQGLTDFPIERIAEQVNPDQHQRALLNDLKAATVNAVNILQSACPNELPSTPTGRVAAMRSRIEAMLQAVQTVRPPLDAFYGSLNDEQKERFNTLDEDIKTAGREIDVAGLCSGPAARGAGLPVARIERSLQLNVRQDTALKDLNDASAQAADMLKASCQPDRSMTPTGRLAAIQDRLKSMLQALDTVQPALVKFYRSLSDEQKARFDRLNVRAT